MAEDKLFKGKIVWVTGGSSGIGEALIKKIALKGAIVIASSNDQKGLERVKRECNERSGNVYCVPFDLTDTSGIESIVNQQMNNFGRIDFLINIGGISQRARIEETPLWLDRKIFEINYFGTIALTKAVLPYMIRQKSGHIRISAAIFILSIKAGASWFY
jgi:short-subunit dehydrogenase